MNISECIILVLCAVFSAVHTTEYIITKPSTTITDENWTNILSGNWLVEFKAPWCPACNSFDATWNKLANWKLALSHEIADVDVTKNPVLSGRFLVTSLPSIYHISNGVIRQYVGARDEVSMVELLRQEQWKDIEPVNWWFNPTYSHMACVGFLFKVSMAVREFYSSMVHDYGIPEWACYVIIAVAVIIVGLLLGLVFVVVCDYLFPSRPAPPAPVRMPENEEDNDILDDTRSGDGDVPSSLRKRLVDTSKQ